MPTTPDPPPLEIYLLGMIDFDEAQRLQRRLVYDLGETGGAALILCEHPPTLSVGRLGSRAHIRPDDDDLKAMGIRTHWVNRGGGCLLHLPGQLNAYVLMPLQQVGLDVRAYLDGLHQAIIAVLAEFDLQGATHPQAPGIFLGHGRVASVGIAVSRWIAYHGLTLNVGPYLEPFGILDEPGPDAYTIHQTSMESRRQRRAPMSQVRESLIRQLEATFGLRSHHLFTQHPLIRRKARQNAYAHQSLG